MNIIEAAAHAAEQIADARRKTENQFAKELKKQVLFIGEDKDFNSYLQEQDVKITEHEVEGPNGQFVLYAALRKDQLLMASYFEYESTFLKGALKIQVKGGHLDMTTEQYNKAIADLEKESEPEKDDCSCPVCELRRALTK